MVDKERYIPSQGDFVMLSFDPQSGHEQKGRRPALVVSKYLFNKHTRLSLVCPVTNTSRNIPFHIPVPTPSALTGFVMVEQIKSVDYLNRRVQFIGQASTQLLNEVLAVLDAIIY
jgi:mRNA interferase MazF